uniref:Uncharacterized protein n=1 Tax=Clastoptera arizonana TaxID=38151 RepID=A0A1B6DRU4_9HEMI
MKLIVYIAFILGTAFSVKVLHIGRYLHQIDENMYDILRPINDSDFTKESGDQLLSYIKHYYEKFIEFDQQVKNRTNGIDKAADFFLTNKGPQFIHLMINDSKKKLKKAFHWDDEKLQIYIDTKKKIQKLWRKFKIHVHDMKYDEQIRRIEESLKKNPQYK